MIIAFQPVRGIRPAHEREPDVDGAGQKHLRRHHADDRVGLITKVNGAPEDTGIALKNAEPKLVADYRKQRSADPIFFVGESATELRREANDLEEIRRHERTRKLLRRVMF